MLDLFWLLLFLLRPILLCLLLRIDLVGNLIIRLAIPFFGKLSTSISIHRFEILRHLPIRTLLGFVPIGLVVRIDALRMVLVLISIQTQTVRYVDQH